MHLSVWGCFGRDGRRRVFSRADYRIYLSHYFLLILSFLVEQAITMRNPIPKIPVPYIREVD